MSDTQDDFLKSKILNPYKGAFYRYYGFKFSKIKRAYGILRVYQALIALDDFLMDRVEKVLKGEKIIFNLTPDYLASVKFIIDAFEQNEWKLKANELAELHTSILPYLKAIDSDIKLKLSSFLKKNRSEDGSEIRSLSEIHNIWKEATRESTYKKIVEVMGSMIEVICDTINLPIHTEKKFNKDLNIYYSLFSIVTKPEMSLEMASEDVAAQIEFNKKLVEVKEAKIKKSMVEEGLKVGRLRFGPYMLMVGSDPKEMETITTPDGNVKSQNKIKRIYCDQFHDFNGGYFETMQELQEYAKDYNAKYNALRSLVHNPTIVTTPLEGSKIYQQELEPDAEGRVLGTFLNSQITYTYIYAKEDGTRGQGVKGTKPQDVFHTVNRLSEEALAKATGPVTTRELTDVDRDDKFTRYSLKRNVETRMLVDSVGRERIVITSGKYRGFFLDDIVNIEGRMVEGTSYTFNLKGRVNKYEVIEKGQLKLENLQEPYITLCQSSACKSDDEAEKILTCRFYLGIPYDSLASNKFKAERDAMEALSKKISDIEKIPNTFRQFWTFSAASYEAIRTALGSCALSHSASGLLDLYYKDLLKKEYALKENNVKLYSADRIEGFVSNVDGKPFKLNNKQMEALAWLDANSFAGVMALDTGVGKTLLATAAILLSKQREKQENSKPRRFLFVQPKALVGNLADQSVAKFCSNPKEIKERFDEISYDTFMSNWDPSNANKLNSAYNQQKYYAIFFDEINYASKGNKAKAISSLNHPRKILLTGSAIEKDPTDLFKFVALTKGIDISSPAEQNKFIRRYANLVGGRFVGVKPSMKQEFDKWVRVNAYFADKQDVNYVDIGQPILHKPVPQTKNIVLPKVLENLYKKKSQEVAKNLKDMLKVYSKSSEERAKINDESKSYLKDFATGSLAKQIKLLHDLSSNPKKAISRIPESELRAFGITKNMIKSMKNPKVESAIEVAKEKIKAGKKVIYFTDDNLLAIENAMSLSQQMPSSAHIVCLLTKIMVFVNGDLKKTFTSSTPIGDSVEDMLFKKANDESKMDDEELEKKTKWAQVVLKEVVLANLKYFATMTCTKPYARGFNFQPFTSVVHLDRNGWSSEEMKQRTARAYRTGQTEVVDEIFLDVVFENNKDTDLKSVTQKIMDGNEKLLNDDWQEIIKDKTGELKPAILKYRSEGNYNNLYNYLQGIYLQSKSEKGTTIDELKGLVQGKDQEFFNSIIKDAMNLKLLESFEAVQRDSSKSIGTSARLLMRAVNPTAEEVANLQSLQNKASSDPLYYDTPLDDRRFNKANLKSLQGALQGSPLTPADAMDISGMGEVFNLSLNHNSNPSVSLPQVKTTADSVIISQPDKPDSLVKNLQVVIKHDGAKPSSVHVNSLDIKDCAPVGVFPSVLLSMIKNAFSSGAATISVTASAEDVSAYVKLGFDADIPYSLIEYLSKNPDEIVLNIFSDLTNDALGNKADVPKLGLFTMFKKSHNGVTGSDLWKRNPVPLTLTLELGNSNNLSPMRDYFQGKARELGIDASHFFTKKELAPFNTVDAKCWLSFLNGGMNDYCDLPKEFVTKKYFQDLKKAIISNSALSTSLVSAASKAVPSLKKQLESMISRLNTDADLQSKVQFVDDMNKKAKLRKKASAISSIENDPILQNVWSALIELEKANDLALELNFTMNDFLKK